MRRFARTWYHPAQLEFTFEFLLDEPIEWDDERPVRRIVPARGRQAPATTAARSIFEMASILGELADLDDAPSPYPVRVAAVTRTTGLTRCVGAQYPANRWTEEREEQEKARRARQKPPKPTRKAKTMSRKLADLVGSED